jgi:7-cyano-7-deazaguanine synthase
MSDLLLLSGGIDSIAVAAWCRPALCLTIDYGQRPAGAEIQASQQICKALGLNHQLLSVPTSHLGCGDLAGDDPSVLSPHSEFWPFRNQYLLTLGAMTAAKAGCSQVLIGTVLTDQRHRDGGPAFIEAMDQLVRLQEGGLSISAPAAGLTSGDLVRRSGIDPDVLAWAHSCHVGNLACGRCRGCQKHSEVMETLGLPR